MTQEGNRPVQIRYTYIELLFSEILLHLNHLPEHDGRGWARLLVWDICLEMLVIMFKWPLWETLYSASLWRGTAKERMRLPNYYYSFRKPYCKLEDYPKESVRCWIGSTERNRKVLATYILGKKWRSCPVYGAWSCLFNPVIALVSHYYHVPLDGI